MKCQARFFDGHKSIPYTVDVALVQDSLHFSLNTEDGVMQIQWPLADLILIEAAYENKPGILSCRATPEARMVIADLNFYQQLFPLINKKQIQLSEVHHSWKMVWLMCIAVIILFIGLIWSLPKSAPLIARHIPYSWDNKLGQMVIRIMAKDRLQCVDPNGKAALATMVTRITKNHNLQYPLDVKVIDYGESGINAFAVSGNHIVIMNGLLQFADDPDQVAAILAHEIGHVIEHHPTQSVIQQLGLQVLIMGTTGTSFDIPTRLMQMKYSRDNEQVADQIAVMLLKQANINTQAYISFFQKIMKREGEGSHLSWFDYLSSHPASSERIKLIEMNSKDQKTSPSLSAAQWKALREICQKKAEISF